MCFTNVLAFLPTSYFPGGKYSLAKSLRFIHKHVTCKLKKKPAAQIAHLVFADTEAKTKNQKSYFLPTLDISLAEKYVN